MTDYEVVDLGGTPVLETTPVVAGPTGFSAYQLAVRNGFEGTEVEWLASLGDGEGGGAVDSVNGETGVVVLSAADVGADPAGSAATAQAAAIAAAVSDATTKADAAQAASTPVAHAADTANPHAVTKTQVGLGDVDNTADTAKPVSTAQAAADATVQAAAVQRANHTGTQTSATISDFTEASQDAVAALLASGTNVTLTYDDSANSLTVTAASGPDAETMRDTIGAALVGVGNIAVTINDAGDTITVSTTATVNSTDAALRDRSTHTGTQSADTLTDGTTNKAFTATERTKLTGVATGATANSTDATLLARANHAGTQTLATISDVGTAAAKNTGTASGEVPLLGTGGRLDIARVASGTPDGTKFVKDDGTLATPAGGGSTVPADQFQGLWWGVTGSGTTAALAPDLIYLVPHSPGFGHPVKTIGIRTTTAPSAPINVEVGLYDMTTGNLIQSFGNISVSTAAVIPGAAAVASSLTGPVFFALKIRSASANGAVFKAGVVGALSPIPDTFSNSAAMTLPHVGTGALPATLPTSGAAVSLVTPFFAFKAA